MDISVKIGEARLPNPVGVASGTFGFGEEYGQLVDLSRLGAVYAKALTLEVRPGNDTPRMVETPSGMLNSIGLANPGWEGFREKKAPFLKSMPCPAVLNIGGKKEADYLELVEKCEELDCHWGYEINISCPNVKAGGLAFGTDPAQVENLTKKLRPLTKKPLIMKLTPNVTDIGEIAKAAEAGGADAVSAINTLKGMVIDTKAQKPVIPAGVAGLSGAAVRPVGVASVYRIAQSVSLPVIGLGGIFTADHAIQYLLAGASAVQVGTALFVDPQIPLQVLEGIKVYMEENRFTSLKDFHGRF
ncbi:MAG: dihydroorotate dehydrogenase [Spirochaetales bacterium]|nr:dihydroorotate dehydrogenase [Spirochaetales bacterium]